MFVSDYFTQNTGAKIMLPRVVIKTCTCHAPVLKEEGNKNLARVLAYQLDYSKYFACHASRLLVFTFQVN